MKTDPQNDEMLMSVKHSTKTQSMNTTKARGVAAKKMIEGGKLPY